MKINFIFIRGLKKKEYINANYQDLDKYIAIKKIQYTNITVMFLHLNVRSGKD